MGAPPEPLACFGADNDIHPSVAWVKLNANWIRGKGREAGGWAKLN